MKRDRIDMHAHVLPEPYLRALDSPVPLPPAPLAALEETMERFEVDAAVVSTGPPGAPTAEVARIANEAIAEIVRGAPERFAGLALVPLPDVDAALEELEHALDTLGLDGVLLLTNVAGVYLGDGSFDPLLAELDRRGAYTFVHPWVPPYKPPLEHPVWLYEFPFDTTRAMANLVYSGSFERFPRIRWQVSHLGGAATFLAHRIASLADREPALAEAAPAGAVEYLRRLYYDTGLANNAPALAAALEVTSLDHIVFGTDWPYLSLPAEGRDPAPDLPERSRRQIEGANAGALVPRFAQSIVS
jgi:predicted TIM-barrel fold metal-dependent hydrolase